MRWWLLLLVGCRQILGIDDPHAQIDSSIKRDTASIDAAADASIYRDAPSLDCSQLPLSPPDTVVETQNGGATTLRINSFRIGVGGTKYVVTPAGAPFSSSFKYTWNDTACSGGCVDQIEIGYVQGDRFGCPFDAVVPTATPTSGDTSISMSAPITPGWTSIRIAIGQNFSCTHNGATTWFFGQPPASDIVGYVCVH